MSREKLSGKERTLRSIRHEEPDRVPLNVWMFRDDMRARVVERYGSLERFHEELGIDVFMAVTPPPNRHNPGFSEDGMNMSFEDIKEADFLDPDDPTIYEEVRALVESHGAEKCVLAHVWGVLESAYSFIGVEDTLLRFGLWEPATRELFRKLGDWSARVASNVVELGIDVLHISGDMGANERMIVSPRSWRERIAPLDAEIIAPGRERGLPLSLHSCGFFRPIIDDLIGMGIEVMHPLQQSAGFDLVDVKATWGERITIHGGLEIRHYLPHATEAELVEHVKSNVLACKGGGGFIFNTEHTVQPDTELDRVELAYRTAREHGWYE